jgi:hypothetical protein
LIATRYLGWIVVFWGAIGVLIGIAFGYGAFWLVSPAVHP